MLNPLPASQWNYQTAAHLLNRAGFGGTPEETEAIRAAGLSGTLERLLHPPEQPALEDEKEEPWTAPQNLLARRREARRLKRDRQENSAKLRAMRRERAGQMVGLRGWWLERMLEPRAALLEKMTLFWHGHFATSAVKVKSAYWMWRQNETFRRYALDNFRTLLGAVSRDPAMLIFLDLARSQKNHPNENWARELMELFTLGVGHYNEEDIRESARAFTGYRVNLANQEFHFEPAEQDKGQKKFFGHTGKFSGDDILDLIVAAPACPQFLGRKLWRFFVEDDPPASMVDAVAASLRRHQLELRPVLREIFSSAEFYSPRVVGQQIKSPVQFLIQSCKLLETELPSERVSQTALQQMGQLPFAPPNVKGWDGGKAWITTSTLLFRYNFANYLLNGTAGYPNLPANLQRAPLELGKIIPADLRDKPAKLIAHLARRLAQSQPNEKQTTAFLAYLKAREPDRSDANLRGLVHLMMSTPQYQLT